jgi:glycine cleavage system H protein
MDIIANQKFKFNIKGNIMRFTRDHEWVRQDGDTALVGITAYAANALGDVVFVEVPDTGKILKKGEGFAVVESVKAASDVYAPVDGVVLEANEALTGSPETINAEPEGAGWFAKIKLDDPAQLTALMDQTAYDDYLKTL